jgi:AAA domain
VARCWAVFDFSTGRAQFILTSVTMPAAPTNSVGDDADLLTEEDQDSPDIQPPPVSQQVWKHGDLSGKMQAAVFACALSAPDHFADFWQEGQHLFEGVIATELYFTARRLLKKGTSLSLTAIHEQYRSKIRRDSRDENECDEKWDNLAEFVTLIEKTDTAKELPFVQERLEGWLRSCRHDTALNAYAQAAINGRDQKELVQRRIELIRALKDMDAPLGTGSGSHFTICTMEEIMADDGKPPEWVVEYLMPAEGVGTISGRAKEGKTWAALDLCLSVASGTDWLQFKTKQGRACYVNFELGGKTLRSRIKNIAAAKQVELNALKERFLPLTIDTGGLVAAALEQKLEVVFTSLVLEQVRRGLDKAGMRNPTMIVLDSFYNFSGQLNENDAADVGQVYHLLRKLANDLNCMVVVIHHFAKGSPGEKMEGDRAAGSRVHRQEPNTYIELAPHKDDGALIFSVDLRDYPPIPKFCLRFEFPLFEDAPELDPADLKRPPRRGRKEKEYDPKEIMALLQDGPLSNGEWLAATIKELDTSQSTFYRAKRELKNAGKVIEKAEKWELSHGPDSNRRKTSVNH